MKSIFFWMLPFMLVLQHMSGQGVYVWVRLSGDRVITNAILRDFSGDTLYVDNGNSVSSLMLSDVVQFRAIQRSSAVHGVLTGVASGLTLGVTVAGLGSSAGQSNSAIPATVIGFAVLGGIVGGTISTLEKPHDLVTLEGKSLAEKRQILQDLVRTNHADQP